MGGIDLVAHWLTETEVDAAILANGSSGRELGYAEITSSFTQVAAATTDYDITGLSVTVTVGTRPILLEAYLPTVAHTVANSTVILRVYEGATLLQVVTEATPATGGALSGARIARVRLAPSAGSHTYKAVIRTQTAGTITVTAGTTGPAFIRVVEG